MSKHPHALQFIKQQHDRGCVVACAAMLAGVTYEQVLRDQMRGFTLDEVLHLRTIEWSIYLNHLGFEVGRLSWEAGFFPELPVLPKGIRYLCGLGLVEGHPKSNPNNVHAVVIDENGIVFDPATDAPNAYPLIHYQEYPSQIMLVLSVEDRRLMNTL